MPATRVCFRATRCTVRWSWSWPEWDALAAATPAAFIERDWGVHRGAEATLVLLNGSPLEDITNTRRIVSVYLRGAEIDREAIGARLRGEAP